MPDEITEKDANRAAFEAQRAALLKEHSGKFALFHDGALVDVYDSMDSAYKAGVEQFGLEGLYIGRVTDKPAMAQLPALMHGLVHAHI